MNYESIISVTRVFDSIQQAQDMVEKKLKYFFDNPQEVIKVITINFYSQF